MAYEIHIAFVSYIFAFRIEVGESTKSNIESQAFAM